MWDTCGLKSGAAYTSTKLIFFLKLERAAFNQVRSVVRNLRYVKGKENIYKKTSEKNFKFVDTQTWPFSRKAMNSGKNNTASNREVNKNSQKNIHVIPFVV